MPAPQSHDQRNAQIIEAYKAGTKVTKIEDDFGLDRATIYGVLAAAGIQPQRIQRRRLVARDAVETATELAMQLEGLGALTARLTADLNTVITKNLDLTAENDILRKRLDEMSARLDGSGPPSRRRKATT
jgi:hypothetical protein